MIKIRGQELDINIQEEIEPYLDQFERMQIREDELISCSPFRDESRPSFALNLESGLWVDFGAGSEQLSRGGFVTLLAHLRQETVYETIDYLLEVYGHRLDNTEELQLNIDLHINAPEVVLLAKEKYQHLINKPSTYLGSRGVSERIQLHFNCGISEKGDAVVIPWHNSEGRIINCKYRNTTTKAFWYSSGGQPVKKHIYGLFAVLELFKELELFGLERPPVYLVESEIDALYLWSLGYCAVAFGGSSMSKEQKELMLLLGECELILATDNDEVGKKFRGILNKELGGYFSIREALIPDGYKDMNDLTAEQIEKLVLETIPLF